MNDFEEGLALPAALQEIIEDPVRRRDMQFALCAADMVSPPPDVSHTALVVLRDAISRLAGIHESELVARFALPTSYRTPNSTCAVEP